MKNGQFSVAQIMAVLKQAEGGTPVSELCREHGMSSALARCAFEISETCYRYSPVLSDENEEVADRLERLTANKRS